MCITFFCICPFEKSVQKEPSNQSENPDESLNDSEKKDKDSANCPKTKKIHKTKKSKSSGSDNVCKKMTTCQENLVSKESQIFCQEQKPEVVQSIKECQQKNQIKFVIAFNRDEQAHRKTRTFGPFEQDPNIYAGRDYKSGGTWLGVNIKTKIMVILTNYDLIEFRPGKSRGQLVKSFLTSDFYSEEQTKDNVLRHKKINEKLTEVLSQSKLYSAFNLLVFSIPTLTMFYICSEQEEKVPTILKRNQSYGVCNGHIDDVWAKTAHGLNLFQKILKQSSDKSNQAIFQSLYTLMKNKKRFDRNLETQAAIFVQPYFSKYEEALRMTKSTFFAIIRQKTTYSKQDVENDSNAISKEQKHFELQIRQVTHKDLTFSTKSLKKGSKKLSSRKDSLTEGRHPQKIPQDQFTKNIDENSQNFVYDHQQQKTVQFSFIL